MLKASRNLIFLCLLVLPASNCDFYKTSGESVSTRSLPTPTPNNASSPTRQKKDERQPIPETGETIEDFIPETAKLVEKAEGDLNDDCEPDAAPTKQSDSSPTKQEKIVVSSEKKLQENFAEEIPPSGQTPEDFVPDGGALVKKATGDLDGDGRDDGALVVLNKTSEVFELGGRIIAAEQYKQFLIIARQNADGRFELEAHSDTALFSLIAGDAENSSAEIKIKDGKIRLRQISAFRDTMSIHENSVEKTADGWQVSGGRVTTEIPQTKIYKDGLRRIDVFEARQKTAVPLKDFDIETVELKPRRKIRTY